MNMTTPRLFMTFSLSTAQMTSASLNSSRSTLRWEFYRPASCVFISFLVHRHVFCTTPSCVNSVRPCNINSGVGVWNRLLIVSPAGYLLTFGVFGFLDGVHHPDPGLRFRLPSRSAAHLHWAERVGLKYITIVFFPCGKEKTLVT